MSTASSPAKSRSSQKSSPSRFCIGRPPFPSPHSPIASELQRAQLKSLIKGLDRVLVAYSGGIDSTLVLKLAHDYLSENTAAAIAVSPSLANHDLEDARNVAHDIGCELIELTSTETADPRYQANNPDRCYFCKTNVYDTLIAHAGKEGFHWILDGTNADDFGDHRPGLRAAREHGVRSPLQEIGLNKNDIRSYAQELGLSNWNKPANACLSSRIPYGSQVTPEKLSQVEKAELILKTLGFLGHRVRHHDTIARLEIPPDQLQRALDQRDTLTEALKPLGFLYITLDLAGYQTGSLNKALKKKR
ncbi:MAG: ATP-dependent sacrificial sulfur transferase LarE [Verrucomicrobiota bacterium]